MMYDEHVHAGFRVVGFTREAANHRHTERGFQNLCAFNGVQHEQAPWQWSYASSAAMRGMMDCGQVVKVGLFQAASADS